MILRTLPLAAVAMLALSQTAAAGEAQDLIFRVGLLDPVATGQTLVYRHERAGDLAVAPVPAIAEGTVEVALTADDDAGRAARLEIAEAGEPRSRALLPAGGGHPVMLVFLESNARNVAALTGGSPFYIRNRMREALADDVAVEPVELELGGRTVPAESMTFRPFADDPNRAALGPFTDLALTMVLSDAVPGAFARFEAAAGGGADGSPAFVETIVFDHLEEE